MGRREELSGGRLSEDRGELIHPPLSAVVRDCPATRAAALIGDSWTLLILREMFAGRRRFTEFANALGISRAVLTDRLKRLADADLITQDGAETGNARRDYVLTPKGHDTLGVLCMQDAWESAYGVGHQTVRPINQTSREPVQPVLLTRPGGVPLEVRRLAFDFVGGQGPAETSSNSRRRGEGAQPTGVTGALAVLGDPWAWRILISAFLGVRRFDEFGQVLGIASNVLTDRLNRLIDADLMLRERYNRLPPRFEYRLAVAGQALHPLFGAMYGWGERWLYDGEELPMRLFDRLTGERITPVVCDAATRQPLDRADLQFASKSIAA